MNNPVVMAILKALSERDRRIDELQLAATNAGIQSYEQLRHYIDRLVDQGAIEYYFLGTKPHAKQYFCLPIKKPSDCAEGVVKEFGDEQC